MIYGYVRVSTLDQCEDRQIAAMQKEHVDVIYMDKASGKDFNRPEYQKMCEKIKENDLLIIKSIDRLGRNYQEIQEQWRFLTRVRKVQIYVLDMPLLDTREKHDLLGEFIADLVLQILSFVAETERSFIKERQKEGIAQARQRGVRFGRPKLEIPPDFPGRFEQWKNKEVRMQTILEEYGISRSTFYRFVRDMDSETGNSMAAALPYEEKAAVQTNETERI